ncbi:MAG: tRNA (N(6)-L-threonylcarbamoyladenosine(37)-C(2))-methylthiotransferase MtaB [Rhodospirillales bacterium]|jgi:threonylcarbamoyladenosine tRNA methylthiotransferase MtaB|nr:tRNA (N(6)-L-threonylcarbamoyladenosine(37)-C(2))-methylthiotransferase MtaB [Rhodospirillales bacterium]
MSAPRVISLGCRLNAFESELMREHSVQSGTQDVVIINTCTVTAEAERRSRQTVRKACRDNADAEIVVTGCAAQLDPQGFAAISGVARVVGNAEKLEPETFKIGDHPEIDVADIMTVRETAPHLIDGFDGRARVFIQIQQGCDHRCTFCIIPFARGPNRSVPMGAIADQIRKLVETGFCEVVLTGVDIASYGADLPGNPSLGDLVRRLLAAVPELKRLRLSSIDPAVMDEALFAVLAEEDRLMPHIHLSLQAMDDMVLKRMKRRHSVKDAIAFAERARQARPDVVFGADLIAGFPTESDEMFTATLNAVEDLGVTHYHVFPYSERPGTPAASMPVVEKAVRKNRAEALRTLGAQALKEFLESCIGKSALVLVERNGTGFSEHYASVHIDTDVEPGTIVNVKINKTDGEKLFASPAA